MLPTRLQNVAKIAISVLVIVLLLLLWRGLGISVTDRTWITRLPNNIFRNDKDILAGSFANSTLGVQQIFVVSSEDPSDPASWRQKGIQEAAARTGISLEIVQTSDLQDWEINQVHAGTRGQALAWAAHQRVLRRIIEQRLTTAMVMEDDADWDIDIKRLTAPSGKIATAIRALTGTSTAPNNTLWPYGKDFDVLWIGHCGGRHLAPGPNITFPDENVMPVAEIYVWDKGLYDAAPDGQRMVLKGHGVLCSFAYIVTSSSAARVLERLQRGGDAFDVELNNGCVDTLTCLSVLPELVHQQKVIGGKGSLIKEANGWESNADGDGRPVTANIKYSARCNFNHNPSDLIQCRPTPDDRLRYPLKR